MTRQREMGSTGIGISPIGLGCWQLSGGRGLVGRFWPAQDGELSREIVKASLESGVTLFDTAEIYGNGFSERTLSESLKASEFPLNDVVIATKWWPFLRRAGHIRSSIAERKAALGGLPIGLHQIHQRLSISTIASQMNAMADLVEAGAIRSVGVSNFSARAMQAAHDALAGRGIPLASNQLRYSLIDRAIETNGVLDLARRLGVTIIAYSPLAQGVLSGRFHRSPDLIAATPGPRRRLRPFRREALARSRPLVDKLTEVGAAHGATTAQVALAWLITRWGETVVAIPGASRVEQARANAGSMRIELSGEEVRAIEEASDRARG